MFLKLLVPLICFVNFQLAIATINCDYYVSELQGYSCRLTIDNPDGLNNYAGISGTHVAGFSDVDVLYVYNTVGSISRNVPMIICKQFTRLRRVYLQSAGIQRIDDSSFRNCANLEYLSFFNNSLSVLEQNSFVGNQNLERLLFVKTDIEELPANIFSPLVRMDTLWILESSLKILHSESFGDLPNLKIAHFNFNQINAIDERLIDNTGIVEVFMPGNVCFGGMVNDGTPTRSHLREVLARCFENYEILANETSTPGIPTTPAECLEGNLDNRVCELEREVYELRGDNRMMTQQIENLSRSLEELENLVRELLSR